MKKIILLSSIFLISSCMPTYTLIPPKGKSRDKLNDERVKCSMLANSDVQVVRSPYPNTIYQRSLHRCLAGYGWNIKTSQPQQSQYNNQTSTNNQDDEPLSSIALDLNKPKKLKSGFCVDDFDQHSSVNSLCF